MFPASYHVSIILYLASETYVLDTSIEKTLLVFVDLANVVDLLDSLWTKLHLRGEEVAL
jgi:hypothetical protein